jgi:peptidyl-prolyl cis-trans isomerase C
MISLSPRAKLNTIALLVLTALLAACGGGPQTADATPTNLPDAEQITPTQPAAVAIVNGEQIPQDLYNIRVQQYQAAQTQTGTLLATDGMAQIVVDDLIDRQLLAQAARTEGFVLDDATIDQRLNAVVEQAGGQDAFNAWMTAQGYTAESFRRDLALEIEAGWMRTRITDAVPLTAEQVQARQILLLDLFSAERLLGQLEGGTPFEQVARNNDPQGLGYLGWFPRGYLLQTEVEEAAFALQPGQFSQVVQSSLGYHLIEVLDRSPDRELTPQARLSLQLKAVQDWLASQRSQATIEVFLP